jgi:hypothetical protein
MLPIEGMTLPLLACFAGGAALLVASIRATGGDRRVALLLGIAAVALLGASGLFLAGNRRDEMAGIPHIVMGGLVFWGLFVPILAAAFYLHLWKNGGHQ